MATVIKPTKAKAAQRVIEVLDFFDEQHRQASVMDIARRYNRPQSSTSELLASLVDLGLLYKDAASRSYTLTPRAAILGSLSQPRMVRDGILSTLIDDLRSQTGHGVALVGMVGPNAQMFRWKPGVQPLDLAANHSLMGGAQDRLCDSAAGLLLLSTLPVQRREGLLRRLNAEATEEQKFNHGEMSARVQECGQQGCAIGAAGFDSAASLAAILLPNEPNERPLALGFIYQASGESDPAGLIAILQRAVQRCAAPIGDMDTLSSIANAA
jgi:DNA-binding IclR family transcriptional regulator